MYACIYYACKGDSVRVWMTDRIITTTELLSVQRSVLRDQLIIRDTSKKRNTIDWNLIRDEKSIEPAVISNILI